MNVHRIKRPSPAFVVALIALFVGLGGTAGAVVNAVVPLAKRALVADNAKKLGGQTSAQIAAQATAKALAQSPAGSRPSSTSAGLVAVKSQTGQIPAGGAQPLQIACDAGQKVMGGGFSSDQFVLGLDSYPANDTTWSVFLANANDAAPANVSIYATCLK